MNNKASIKLNLPSSKAMITRKIAPAKKGKSLETISQLKTAFLLAIIIKR